MTIIVYYTTLISSVMDVMKMGNFATGVEFQPSLLVILGLACEPLYYVGSLMQPPCKYLLVYVCGFLTVTLIINIKFVIMYFELNIYI